MDEIRERIEIIPMRNRNAKKSNIAKIKRLRITERIRIEIFSIKITVRISNLVAP